MLIQRRNRPHHEPRYALAVKSTFCVIALAVWGMMPQLTAAQPSPLHPPTLAVAPFDPNAPEVLRDLAELEKTLNDTTVSQELNALPALTPVQSGEQFLAFRHHQQDASWVSPEPAEPVQAQPGLSETAAALLYHGLSPVAGMVPAHNVKAAVMRLMTQEQAWAALDLLENGMYFGASARLAQAMLERESNPWSQDVLALVAARATWMQSGRATPEYQSLIARACNASQNTVAASAKLWREAVGGPQTAEGLILANQIWTTLWVDMSRNQRGAELARRIAACGKHVYEQELKSSKAQAEKEQALGRMAAIISRFAFQVEDRAQMQWAVEVSNGLAQAGAEDKLYPQYNYAMEFYANDNYSAAIDEFSKLFFSGIPCDLAADAGCCIASCNSLKGDDVGALAALEMTVKLYGEQKRIMRRAKAIRDEYRRRLGMNQEEEISQYIERHYRTRLERALAQKARRAPARDMAMN